jgi:hypothetical protein
MDQGAALLERMITGWSFAQDVTPENIDELDSRIVAELMTMFASMQKPRSKEETLPLDSGSTSSSSPSTNGARVQETPAPVS